MVDKNKIKSAINNIKNKKEEVKKTSSKNPEINDKVQIEFEPSLNDFYTGMDEIFNAVADGEDILTEVMSVAGRVKRRQQMRRYKARMQIARKRQMRRRASVSVINRRARRGALLNVKKRLSGGKTPSKMSYGDRARIERLAKRRKAFVTRSARRMVLSKRQLDRTRFSNRR